MKYLAHVYLSAALQKEKHRRAAGLAQSWARATPVLTS